MARTADGVQNAFNGAIGAAIPTSLTSCSDGPMAANNRVFAAPDALLQLGRTDWKFEM